MRVLLLLLIAINLYAHALRVFTQDDNNTLYIESFFTKSSPCIECDISITQSGITTNTKTDQNGKAEYKIISKDTIKVSINAGVGHYKEVEYIPNTFVQPQEDNDVSKFIISLLAIGLIFYLLKRYKR